MASAGTVTLNLDANSVKLLRELQKADKSTRKTTGKMQADFKRLAANVAKTAAVMGAAFAAMSVKMTRDGMKSIDSQAKMARALGASNDALKSLQMAADDAGLQGLDASLNRMNRRLGAAEFGAGAAAVTVEKLNLNLAELSGMDIDDRLQSIAKTMREAGLSTEEQARHLQNLGFEQAQANDFFRNGISDLDGYRTEIDALGLSLSDVDARKVEQAGDALGIFGDIVEGIGRQFAIAASGTITILADEVKDLVIETDKFGLAADSFEEKFRLAMASVIEKTGAVIGFFEGRSEMVQFGLMGFILFGKKGAAIGGAIGAAFSLVNAELRKIGIGVDDNAARMARMTERAEALNNALASAREAQGRGQNMDRQISNYEQQLALVNADLENLRAIMSDAAWEDFSQFFVESEKDATSLSAALQRLAEQLRQGESAFVGPLLPVEEISGELDEASDDVNDFFNRFTAIQEQAAKSMQSSFADFFFDPFKDGLKGMAESFVNVIRRMIAETMALKAIMALAGMGGPIGSFFQMALPTMDKGGRGVAGQPYMIGRGAQPEVFIPDSAGTFIPNADKMGGQALTINVDARDVGAEARIRDMINNEMAPQIIAAAKGSTVAALRRPRFA